MQIDGFNELPKEKRPPEQMLWEGSPDDLDDWLDRVFGKEQTNPEFIIDESSLEG